MTLQTLPILLQIPTLTDSSSLFLLSFKALDTIPSLADIINLHIDEYPAIAIKKDVDCVHDIALQFMPPGIGATKNDRSSTIDKFVNYARVYPNPTSGRLTFEIATNLVAENTILVYNSMGKEILSQKVSLHKGRNVIYMDDIGDWQDGLYYFTITNSTGGHSTGKFVKN